MIITEGVTDCISLMEHGFPAVSPVTVRIREADWERLAGLLARDVERDVSEPILRFCAALSDRDLLDILKSHPASWVVVRASAKP